MGQTLVDSTKDWLDSQGITVQLAAYDQQGLPTKIVEAAATHTYLADLVQLGPNESIALKAQGYLDEVPASVLSQVSIDEVLPIFSRLLGYGGFHRMAWARFYGDDDGAFPRFAERADGYELIDSEGRSFVDWTNGGGPVILGYNHPAVEEAVRAQLAHKAGPTLTLMHPVELEVASKLTEMVPCAEMVAFGKNGSDAVTAAVRIARAATRREVILHHGGHGFHDWFVSSLGAAGVPKAIGSLVHSFPYNDLAALEALFDRFEGQVAAIVMEPVNIAMPAAGYLESVRELAHARGALLIFDEMVTAFRLAPGGAQELFGVTPDLTALGKGIANGMPLSAVVGRREYMRHLPNVAYGMTFRGETLSLAAARCSMWRRVWRSSICRHRKAR